jgi:hypothetical protein
MESLSEEKSRASRCTPKAADFRVFKLLSIPIRNISARNVAARNVSALYILLTSKLRNNINS